MPRQTKTKQASLFPFDEIKELSNRLEQQEKIEAQELLDKRQLAISHLNEFANFVIKQQKDDIQEKLARCILHGGCDVFPFVSLSHYEMYMGMTEVNMSHADEKKVNYTIAEVLKQAVEKIPGFQAFIDGKPGGTDDMYSLNAFYKRKIKRVHQNGGTVAYVDEDTEVENVERVILVTRWKRAPRDDDNI